MKSSHSINVVWDNVTSITTSPAIVPSHTTYFAPTPTSTPLLTSTSTHFFAPTLTPGCAHTPNSYCCSCS